jgi:WD40 repeat protein
MSRTRAILARPIGLAGPSLSIVLALLISGPIAALADTYQVKTERGTFLVEVVEKEFTVRPEGDDLVIIRTGGEEVRLKLDSDRAERLSKEPILAIRREGKVIVSIRRLPTPAKLADLTTVDTPGQTILNQRALAPAWSLAISDDGKKLVSGHQGFLKVWDPETLAERLSVLTGKIGRRVALTPDGSTIASAEYAYINGKPMGNLVIRDGKTGEARKVMKPVEALHGVAIDSTGKVAVTSSWAESDIRVWDVEKGEQVGTLKGHSGAVGTLLYSPDGKTLASGGDSTIRLWDIDTGEVRKILRGHQGSVEAVAFSADGKTIALGGGDDDARVWNVETGKTIAVFECDAPVLAVALTADGKTVATGSARWGNGFYGAAPAEVQVWDVATKKLTARLPDQPAQVFAMLFKPDGKTLFTASLSGAVTAWELAKFPVTEKTP